MDEEALAIKGEELKALLRSELENDFIKVLSGT